MHSGDKPADAPSTSWPCNLTIYPRCLQQKTIMQYSIFLCAPFVMIKNDADKLWQGPAHVKPLDFWLFHLFFLLSLTLFKKNVCDYWPFFIGKFSSLSTFAFKFILSLCFVFSWNYFRYCYDTIFGLLFWLAEHREGGWVVLKLLGTK